MIASLVPEDGHLLVLENGVYGERATRIARAHAIDEMHQVPLTEVKSVRFSVVECGAPTVIARRKALPQRDCDPRQSELLGGASRHFFVRNGIELAAGRIRAGPGAAQFAAIWKGSGTSLRIGLMMAAEEALEADRAALDGLVADLLPTLRTEDAVLRGDTADLLGKIGHRGATEDQPDAAMDDGGAAAAEEGPEGDREDSAVAGRISPDPGAWCPIPRRFRWAPRTGRSQRRLE